MHAKAVRDADCEAVPVEDIFRYGRRILPIPAQQDKRLNRCYTVFFVVGVVERFSALVEECCK